MHTFEALTLLNNAFAGVRNSKTEKLISELGVTVTARNIPQGGGLILATHPLAVDSVVWRQVERLYGRKCFHLINVGSTKKTGNVSIDDFFAYTISSMFRAHKGFEPQVAERRHIMYSWGAQTIQQGSLVVINPTGIASLSNGIPTLDQINTNGAVKIEDTYRHMYGDALNIYPCVLRVSDFPQNPLTFAPNSDIAVIFGHPISSINSQSNDLNYNLVEQWLLLSTQT